MPHSDLNDFLSAPEVLEGKDYGKAVDWWSFGTLMFEMLTGLPPFYCEEPQKMYQKIMTAQLQIPSSFSKEAKDLVEKLLERDPSKRLCDGKQVKEHAFFSSIDWNALINKQIKPPFLPKVKDKYDLGNVDPSFTQEQPSLSFTDPSELENLPNIAGFTFVGTSRIAEGNK